MSPVLRGTPRRVRNARLTRQPDRLQTRLLLAGLALGLVIIVPLMANVWGHAEAVRVGYLLEAARQQRAALLEQNRQLRAEDAALRNLDRIQELALDRLGLSPRRPESTVVVSTVGAPQGPALEPPVKAQPVEVAGAVTPRAATRHGLGGEGGQR